MYSPTFYEKGDGFTSAQAMLNLAENALNITYLVLARRKNPVAILYGFTGVLFTLWKVRLCSLRLVAAGRPHAFLCTSRSPCSPADLGPLLQTVLYWLQDQQCGWCLT